MANQESLSASPSEQMLSFEETSQQAFDLIESFKFVLTQSSVFPKDKLADMFQNKTTRSTNALQQSAIDFSVGNSTYNVKYVLRGDNLQALDIDEEIFSKDEPGEKIDRHHLFLVSRRLKELSNIPLPLVMYIGGGLTHRKRDVCTSSAVEQARGMLRRLSSQK